MVWWRRSRRTSEQLLQLWIAEKAEVMQLPLRLPVCAVDASALSEADLDALLCEAEQTAAG